MEIKELQKKYGGLSELAQKFINDVNTFVGCEVGKDDTETALANIGDSQKELEKGLEESKKW